MKIIILGAGAIGSLYCAKLSMLNDVTLIGRKEHVDKINKNGLKIVGLENKTYKLKAATKIKKIEDKILVILTTKVYDSKEAINSIKSLIKKNTIILCLQNGLYCEKITKKVVGKKYLVLRAITDYGAIFLKQGVIHYSNYGCTIIEKNQKSKELADNFNECGLNCYISKNIKEDMWKKVIFNCVLNPITAILRIENKGIADEKLNPLKKLIANECLKVAKKDGISFNFDFVKKIDESIKNSRNISSMQQDLIKGNKTEIDYLNGAVVELGKKYGIKCAVNEALAQIIKQLEKLSSRDL